jgi:NhaP-type Na+/H+ or K+/H+ antiporter
MEPDVGALALAALCVVVWGLVSRRCEQWNISAPMAFVAFGLLISNGPLDIDIAPRSSSLRVLAEFTLALVLFADASRVNFRALRRDAGLPLRLLLIGLPLTIGLGAVTAYSVLPGTTWWIAGVIGAAIAPTDAALGAPIVEDHRIPRRIRRLLNVESGLNDGIATPFVSFFIVGAAGEAAAGGHTTMHALGDLGTGVLVGVVTGLGGGFLLAWARRTGWGLPDFVPLATVALALVAYTGTLYVSGNGFVGAFVGGLAFGSVPHETGDVALVANAGSLMSLLVWLAFGTWLVPVLQHAEWQVIVLAILGLTVVRMLPVALSLLGTGLDAATIGIVGWFGPRGLASIVFALLAADALPGPQAELILASVGTVVVASVVLHGMTAGPLARWYAHRAVLAIPDHPVHADVDPLPTRTFRRSDS